MTSKTEPDHNGGGAATAHAVADGRRVVERGSALRALRGGSEANEVKPALAADGVVVNATALHTQREQGCGKDQESK